MTFLEKVERFAQDFDSLIEERWGGINRAIRKSERELLRLLLGKLLPSLSVSKSGKIATTARNLAKLSIISEVMAEFYKSEAAPIARRMANELLEVAGRNAEYYILSGFDTEKIKAIAADTALVQAAIGIDARGKLVKDGFLDRLAKSDEIRIRLVNFLTQSFAAGVEPQAFADGLRDLVVGNKDVKGAVARHWRQYAFDAYNQVREIQNSHMANELKLEHFVYAGGLIETSRQFCRERNRKVFTRKEAEKWKDDPNLIDTANISTYNPLIHRGGKNCRHFIMWISKERAIDLRPDLDT